MALVVFDPVLQDHGKLLLAGRLLGFIIGRVAVMMRMIMRGSVVVTHGVRRLISVVGVPRYVYITLTGSGG